jgi:hypothetical protein
MTGNKQWFTDIDEQYQQYVKLGNNFKMAVAGKGNIRLHVNGITQVITNVYYVPELKNNLISIGQLIEKGVSVLIQNGECRCYHSKEGLFLQTKMSTNRMFAFHATPMSQVSTCFKTVLEDETHLWHCRYGHLNCKGLKTLQSKKMVTGLPEIRTPRKLCKDCVKGKQQRKSIPKKSLWRATHKLQLVHSDICGPITPSSNSGKSVNGIKRQLTAAFTPQQNGVAERKNQTIMNMVRCMLSEKHVPKFLWAEAVNWAVHILNRSPTLAVKDKTPEEAWSGIKPDVHYFKVFGCIAHVHIPEAKRKKLDAKSFQCVMLGVSDESKAYRLFDPTTKRIVTSKDVIFEENECWDWERSSENQKSDILDWGESEEEIEETPQSEEENENSEGVEEMGCSSGHSSEEVLEEGRVRRPPIWMQDYESGEGISEEEEETQNLAMLTITSDPTTFEEAVKSEKWRIAMNNEIDAIEKNNTWELTNLPSGAKTIGLKWIFKTKLNENGEVEKYKARLVAKGYSQQYGVDYTEVFAPVARWDTIRMVISLAAQKGWNVYQLDVKSAFLHGELNEQVFVDQPQGYVKKGDELKVYKLKRALYGLKQAPRAWYSRIEAYFTKEGFEKCPYEHTLFVKQSETGNILIVSLYVDDLIFTGNDENMFKEFKKSMEKIN